MGKYRMDDGAHNKHYVHEDAQHGYFVLKF
jgi:hypothetical protein